MIPGQFDGDLLGYICISTPCLVQPEGDSGRALVESEVDVAPGRRVAARLQEAAVHGEARQLPRQLEDVVMLAPLVADESLEKGI